MKRIAIDTETTGLDLYHGAMPYLVTICSSEGELVWYEWDVDPLTREPSVSTSDCLEIIEILKGAEEIVLQNAKHDIKALDLIIPGIAEEWDWEKTHDNLISGHLLASNQQKTLETQALVYLGIDISQFETRVNEETERARRMCRSQFPDWQIAKKGRVDMPSAKGKIWKADMWLLRAIAKELDYPEDHDWWTLTSKYANGDSSVTIQIRDAHIELIKERDLEAIYEVRRKVLQVAYDIESSVGVSVSESRLTESETEFSETAAICQEACIKASGGTLKKLPVNGVSNDLKEVVFEKFKLESPKVTPSGAPSMDKYVLEFWERTLEEGSSPHSFIKNLRTYRKKKTGLGYLQSYRKFGLPAEEEPGWLILHPNLNITGTDTLRWSSSNPNEQQISNQEESNARYSFGPLPGREWWSNDANNIELRIPAYDAGEPDMIDLFERADEPPYYGSNHLLNFHTVYPDIWEQAEKEVGKEKAGLYCKSEHKSTWYSWVKQGGFAVQYGAVDKVDGTGTADQAFRRVGSHALLKSRFKKIHGTGGLNEWCIAHANKYGYIETIPDKEVDPKKGYPLMCSRSAYGAVKPTIPLNYRTQGTAMWWMMIAMMNCYEYLRELNRKVVNLRRDGYFMIMQVHDELVFDFPYKPNLGNLPKVRKLAHLMSKVGDRIGVPTPVGIEYHPETWSKGVKI